MCHSGYPWSEADAAWRGPVSQPSPTGEDTVAQVDSASAHPVSTRVASGDLLGRDAAVSLVRPAMQRLRDRLCTEAFQRVREEYAARRKRG